MEIKRGIPVSSGVAIGEAFVLDYEDYIIPKRIISNHPQSIEEEKKRYKEASDRAIAELKQIEGSTSNMKDLSIIFMGHRYIIEEIQEAIVQTIENSCVTAEYAVSQVMGKNRSKLQSLNSEYHTQRVSDLEDIENRLLKHLLGTQRAKLNNLHNPVILIAKELTPSETAVLPQDRILAFVTDIGGRTSHTAIVARTRGIPAVVGLGCATSQIYGGDMIIVDGRKGLVIINPDSATLEKYRQLQRQESERRIRLQHLFQLPAETIDGYTITLRANIEYPSEVKVAMEYGASGIGLYRTEFIYVNNPNPTEEDHFEAYKSALQYLRKEKIIIRTLDFGADKNFGVEGLQKETNPFLGCRSIRLCFEKIPLFKKQLRAILRASALGNVEIMFPMISSIEEVWRAKGILKEAKEELRQQKIPYNENIRVGIMIEIPSAALCADLLAKEVDFFSIGSNDLIQYTLAVDRINQRVAYMYKPAHPAVLRLLKDVIQIAKSNRIKVSMCGEMSAEFQYLIPLIGMGLRDFSLSSSIIPEAKELIRSISVRRAIQIAEKVQQCRTHEEAIEYLNREIPHL